MSSPEAPDGWPFAGIPSWHVTSHSSQLSLLPSAGWEINTGQLGAVALLLAGKVTAGLASHWQCVTDSVVYRKTLQYNIAGLYFYGYIRLWAQCSEREISSPAYASFTGVTVVRSNNCRISSYIRLVSVTRKSAAYIKHLSPVTMTASSTCH